MVNHIRTILVNLGKAQAAEAGYRFYIDPAFKSIKLDERVESIRSRLIVQGSEVNTVLDAIMSVISRIDLVEHLNRYDTRTDVDVSRDESVFKGFDPEAPRVLFDVMYEKGVPEFLFSRTRDDYTDSELAKLKDLWINDVDGHTGLAACILALVARIELFRTRGSV